MLTRDQPAWLVRGRGPHLVEVAARRGHELTLVIAERRMPCTDAHRVSHKTECPTTVRSSALV